MLQMGLVKECSIKKWQKKIKQQHNKDLAFDVYSSSVSTLSSSGSPEETRDCETLQKNPTLSRDKWELAG